MVDFLSSWAEQIIIAVIIASIIEMILPDNKNKKYIKMVIGIYILFNIISPVINSNDLFSLDNFNLESYAVTEQTQEVNQASMDERLQQLYIEELEKNVSELVESQGYKVVNCSVDAILYGEEEKQGINKIKLVVSKSDQVDKQENNSNIKSVDKVEINVGLSKYLENSTEEGEANNSNELQNLKNQIGQTYEIDSSKIDISIK